MMSTLRIAAAMALTLPATAFAAEIDFLCYQDGNECEVIAELSERFTEQSGHVVNTTIVGYEVIRDQLLPQLQAGDAAPDVSRVTDLGGMAPFFLDLTPYVDVEYFEANFGAPLKWSRPPGDETGIYGLQISMGATGPFVNVTMFEDAGVDIPEAGATWDDWVAALTEVQETLGLEAAFALDRTGHRFGAVALSYGAKIMDENGEPILVDDGFREFTEIFVDWHKNGFMPEEGWPAGTATQYRNAAPLFLNGKVAMHYAGDWMIKNYDEITDFDWRAVPVPCGVGGCGSLLGGPQIVGFDSTEHPEAVGEFIAFLAEIDNNREFLAKSFSIPAHSVLQQEGIDYVGASARVAEALNVFADNALKGVTTTPTGVSFVGYPKNFVIYGAIPDYVTSAIKGDMSLDEALAALDADVKAKIAE